MQKIRKVFLITLFFVIVFVPQCFAFVQENSAENVKLYLQPILSLGIVIALIYIVFGLYSKINKFNFQKFSKQSSKNLEMSRLTLVSHLSLGQNKSINVVEINGKFLVLGVAGDNINLIKEFDNSDDVLDITQVVKPACSEEKKEVLKELYHKYSRGKNE